MNQAHKKNYFCSNHGFTLLEMLISIGIFSVLVIATIGITLSVTQAQIKAANIQVLQDNIRFSVELMTKEMRTGSNFVISGYCTAVPNAEISFEGNSGDRAYFLDSSTNIIMRLKQKIASAGDCLNASALTSEEISVNDLGFRLTGHAIGPTDGQPKITIIMSLTSKSPKLQLESSMNLQTTVIQRLRDL